MRASGGRRESPGRLFERGHHRCGRVAIIPLSLRPDPERTFVASNRMARIDVNRPLQIAAADVALGTEQMSAS
jgi:hypothetical protein